MQLLLEGSAVAAWRAASPSPAGTANRLLLQATRRVQDLTAPTTSTASDPVAAFLKAVDVRQVAVQLPELDAAIAEVEAHKATLPV